MPLSAWLHPKQFYIENYLGNLLSFCLGDTYNALPSPSNVKLWHLASESFSHLASGFLAS